MPCCICSMFPVTVHHIRTGMGMGQKASGFKTIPLCPDHHQNGGHGVALHAGQKTWEAKFGRELDICRTIQQTMMRNGVDVPLDQRV